MLNVFMDICMTRLILRTANKNYVNNINNSDQALRP